MRVVQHTSHHFTSWLWRKVNPSVDQPTNWKVDTCNKLVLTSNNCRMEPSDTGFYTKMFFLFDHFLGKGWFKENRQERTVNLPAKSTNFTAFLQIFPMEHLPMNGHVGMGQADIHRFSSKCKRHWTIPIYIDYLCIYICMPKYYQILAKILCTDPLVSWLIITIHHYISTNKPA